MKLSYSYLFYPNHKKENKVRRNILLKEQTYRKNENSRFRLIESVHVQ